ncbi:hypothetical protein MEM_00772, partial [Candida albicans L26]
EVGNRLGLDSEIGDEVVTVVTVEFAVVGDGDGLKSSSNIILFKSQSSNAISKQNFQGKHIKFDDHDNADEKKDDGNKNDLKKSKNKKPNSTGSKSNSKSKSKLNVKESKITKPKSNKKSSTKNKNK